MINLIKNTESLDHEVCFTLSRLIGPRQVRLANLKTGKSDTLGKEYLGEYLMEDLIEEPFVETAKLSSTFVLHPKRANSNSPVLVWISDKTDFDVYNPIVADLINKEFIILFVRHKSVESPNIKKLIDEVFAIGSQVVASGLGKMTFLLAEGPLSGYLGLAAHLRNLSIYKAACFIDPITDLLEFHNDFPKKDFGYGELKKLENTEDVLEDSPYYKKDSHLMRNILIISTSHKEGYGGLKFFARVKHMVKVDSNVFWTKGTGDLVQDSLKWMGFFWDQVCKFNKEQKKEQDLARAAESKKRSSNTP